MAMGDPWALHKLRGQPVPPSGVDPHLARDLLAGAVLDLYPGLAETPERHEMTHSAASRAATGDVLRRAEEERKAGRRPNLSQIARQLAEEARHAADG